MVVVEEEGCDRNAPQVLSLAYDDLGRNVVVLHVLKVGVLYGLYAQVVE